MTWEFDSLTEAVGADVIVGFDVLLSRYWSIISMTLQSTDHFMRDWWNFTRNIDTTNTCKNI